MMILKFREVKCFSQNQTTAKEAEPGLISSQRVYLIWRINIFILAAESFTKETYSGISVLKAELLSFPIRRQRPRKGMELFTWTSSSFLLDGQGN